MFPPKVAIIILNWNQKAYSIEALESLEKVNYPDREVFFVDNASEDGSPEEIEHRFPWVRMIRNTENLGVAGGRNRGLREALKTDAKYIVFLDNDAIYAEDFLELGMDCVFGVDPVQGGADLETLKEKFRGRVAIWGGVNSAVTLGQGSEEEIGQAVTEAIRILAPGGGFVLYPVDVVLAGANPWNKVKILLNKWRDLGSYPIRI